MVSGTQGIINQPMTQPILQQNSQMNPIQTMIFNKMYQSNPNFRQFANRMMGKTPEQGFGECGLDYNQYRNVDPNQIRNTFGI